MPRIYVEFGKFKQLDENCKRASQRISGVQDDFQRIVGQLDWDIRYRSNIDNTANAIARKIQGCTKALNGYQTFLRDACVAYEALDTYNKGLDTNLKANDDFEQNPLFWEAFIRRFNYKNVIKGFGNAGKIFGVLDGMLSATSWNDWAKQGISAAQIISKFSKDVKNYSKIGRAIGTKNATSYFLKKQLGLRTVGHASKAANPSARFYNNLHNTTSPFNMSDAFAPLVGKAGVGKAVAAWAGVALTGIVNTFSNIEEQKSSNGTMSDGRVAAETIMETTIDTAVTYGGAAVVGAAIAAATGVVAAPVVVAVATGAALAGINAGVEALTGKSATEWVSDAVLDTAVVIGNGISNGAKAVGNWFRSLF